MRKRPYVRKRRFYLGGRKPYVQGRRLYLGGKKRQKGGFIAPVAVWVASKVRKLLGFGRRRRR